MGNTQYEGPKNINFEVYASGKEKISLKVHIKDCFILRLSYRQVK